MLDSRRPSAAQVIRKPVLTPPADMPLDGRQIIASARRPTTVRRFELADLEAWGQWLFTRLVEKHPAITERSFPSFVRSWIQGNEFCFVISGNAVGLATIYHEPLDDKPTVREIFLYCRDSDIEDGQPVYFEFHRWSRLSCAYQLLVGYDSDVPMQAIRETLAPIRAKHIQTVAIEQSLPAL